MKKDTLYYVSVVVGTVIYLALVFGALCAELRGCIYDDVEVKQTVAVPAFKSEFVIEPVGPRVLADAGVDIQRPVVEEKKPAKLYTDEDAVVLAKTVWGEARGVSTLASNCGPVSVKCQQAAVVWTVLNRYDAGWRGGSIAGVAKAPKQFHGYSASYPVEDDILELVYDVLDRWNAEKLGFEDVGRVIPADHYYFYGDGKHNHFRADYNGGKRWDWSLGDPYKI